MPLWARLVGFVVGAPLVLLALLYGILLLGPINLSAARPSVEAMIRDSLPPGSAVDLGEFSLSLSAQFRPVLRFAPVTFTDTGSGAEIGVDALEIGVSPIQAVFGQPGAVVSLIAPRLQLVQDLLGPRLAAFSSRTDPETDGELVEIREGSDAYPEVRIHAGGLQVSGPSPGGDGIGIRSDNEWLVYNFEGMEEALASLENQARNGQFSRLEVRGGSMEMLDPVFGIMRRFDDLNLVLSQRPGGVTKGTLGATLAGRAISGSFERDRAEDGATTTRFSLENFDFAGLIPVLDDPDGLMAVKGAGKLDGTVSYERAGGDISHGRFDVDLAGTEFRLRHEYFPVSKASLSLDWEPKAARFTIEDGELAIGRSSMELTGEVVLGLDNVYGSVLSTALTLKNLYLAPYDLPVPKTPFSEVKIEAWASPLYGALGLDKVVAIKPGVEIRAKGRIDMIRSGIGIDLEMGGEGASADDLKRLWPYFIAGGGRDWFVGHVTTGRMMTGAVRFKAPVGVIDPEVENKPLPPNTGWIDMTAKDVTVIPTEGFSPVALGGEVTLSLRDNKTAVSLGRTQIVSERGQFTVSKAAVVIDAGTPFESVVEFSGDVAGDIPALIGFAESQSPGVIDGFGLPFDARALDGSVDGSAVLTLTFGDDPAPLAIDYAVNGATTDFTSTAKIADRTISNGALSFQATPDVYHVVGTADLDGVPAELFLDGGGDSEAEIKVASTVDTAEFAKFGFDLGELMTGSIRFVAKPLEDGGMQLAADLVDTRLDIKDIGLAKPARVPGSLNAEIHQDGTLTKVTKIDLSFLDVRLKGSLDYDAEAGLVAAEFTDFALSPGDSARLSVEPGTTNGYRVRLSGDQFDLKPMLKRYFAIDQASTGAPQATSVPQELSVTGNLKRALGFFSTTAYNVEFGLALRGENLLDASLQGQFAEGNTVSLTTNPTSGGRQMTVAFNDAGTLLRYLNVYPRVLGGAGSLTLRTDVREKVDYGELRVKDFAIVDEAKVAEIMSSHRDSQKMIAKENRLDIQSGQATFIRRSDRIELVDGFIDGGSIGGTLKGFVYTKARQYDLTGTYIPFFALNNMFQQLPLIGQLIGGKSGEGLVGVTFAVRGDLDNPQFVVNPVSILAPGVFRSLFEFRAVEAPREEQPQ